MGEVGEDQDSSGVLVLQGGVEGDDVGMGEGKEDFHLACGVVRGDVVVLSDDLESEFVGGVRVMVYF